MSDLEWPIILILELKKVCNISSECAEPQYGGIHWLGWLSPGWQQQSQTFICDFNQCFCRHTDTGLCTGQSGSVNTAWLYNTRKHQMDSSDLNQRTSLKWHWSFSLLVCVYVCVSHAIFKKQSEQKNNKSFAGASKRHHCPIEEKVTNHRRLTLNMENFFKRLILEQPTGFSNIMTDSWLRTGYKMQSCDPLMNSLYIYLEI